MRLRLQFLRGTLLHQRKPQDDHDGKAKGMENIMQNGGKVVKKLWGSYAIVENNAELKEKCPFSK